MLKGVQGKNSKAYLSPAQIPRTLDPKPQPSPNQNNASQAVLNVAECPKLGSTLEVT